MPNLTLTCVIEGLEEGLNLLGLSEAPTTAQRLVLVTCIDQHLTERRLIVNTEKGK